jgi:Zn-dependent protease with chaperone function
MSKAKQEKAATKDKKDVSTNTLPIILETCFTLTRLLITILPVAVGGLSLMAGASLFISAFRAGVTAFILGLLAWFINWRLAKGLFGVIAKQFQRAAKSAASEHTVEWRA